MNYGLVIAIAVLTSFILIYVLSGDTMEYMDIKKLYEVSNAQQGVVVDQSYFYVVNNNQIVKYNRRNGKKILSKKLSFEHLNGGKIINSDLVLTNNPKGKNEIIWLDPNTLQTIDILPLPQLKGSLTWIDWAWNKWWICDAFYDDESHKTTIYCFNMDWQLEGYWRLPKKVIERMKPYSSSGGAWFNGQLYVSGHDRPELYILSLPADKIHARLVKIVPVCFDGQGFVFDNGNVWGVRRQESVVVSCNLHQGSK